MYGVLASLKSILHSSDTTTDDWVFQLHYRFTFLLLASFSILVTTNQFFGDPINCFTGYAGEVPEKVINNYCWIRSTFTMPDALNKPSVWDAPYPGIDKGTPEQPKLYHAYYQWVCFFLFFQAILFYLPRFIWKTMEGGTMSKIVLGLGCPLIGKQDEDEPGPEGADPDAEKTKLVPYGTRNRRINSLVRYLDSSMGHHGFYGIFYIICEVLNLVNVIGQIFLTNNFLGGEFTTYGTQVVQFAMTDQINRTDPMIKVFPRVTKCIFHRFGPSGSVQLHDVMCILPINIINEKIFIFLWFWFIILSVITGIKALLAIPSIVSRKWRWLLLSWNTSEDTKEELKYAIGFCDLSDWYILRLLKKNMNPMNFQALAQNLGAELRTDTARA